MLTLPTLPKPAHIRLQNDITTTLARLRKARTTGDTAVELVAQVRLNRLLERYPRRPR